MSTATPIPHVTSAETVDEILKASKRAAAPLRVTFLQQERATGGGKGRGPLAKFVRNQDPQALLLYLLLITKASSAPWNSALPAAVWARALGFPNPTGRRALARVSRIWQRLTDDNLITKDRYKRMARITLLREDGSHEAYTLPASQRDHYLQVPSALWTSGPPVSSPTTTPARWYQTLSLPELAMLLIALSLADDFRLPFADVPNWYGISADTAERGIHGLADYGLIRIGKAHKAAPLTAQGYTTENRYTLKSPFGPKGVAQKRRAP